MASYPSPAKRARTDARPARSRSQLHPPQNHSQSSAAQSRPVQNRASRLVASTVEPQNAQVRTQTRAHAQAQIQDQRQRQPPAAATPTHASSATSQPQAQPQARPRPRPPADHDPLSSVPPGWGPMVIPDNMTMTLHEALEILDPTSKTPHDLYSIVVYAAAAHPDVGQMLDKFAHAAANARKQRRARGVADDDAVAEGRFVPIDDAVPDGTGLREIVEREKQELAAERAAARAARKTARAVKEAKMSERRRQKIASSVIKPGMDKDFAYLVRKAEEELGWTGKWDVERQSNYSRAALRKETYWYNRAVDVRDSLKWMQNQLIKEMGLPGITFGTRRNALFAMMQILHTVAVDDRSGVGKNLRQHWFVVLEEKFKEAMAPITYGELAKLRTENQEKWAKDLKRLIKLVRDKELPDEILKEILLMVDPTSRDPVGSEDESSGSSEEIPECEAGNVDDDDDDDDETSGETSSESEADSESEEDSD